ncbi:unnamed protein product, partial [Coccothraustes coccothraustes]
VEDINFHHLLLYIEKDDLLPGDYKEIDLGELVKQILPLDLPPLILSSNFSELCLTHLSHLFGLCSFWEKKKKKKIVNALSLLCSVLCKLLLYKF